MDKKELDKAIQKTVLKMAMEPKNIEHYHSIVARRRSVPNVNDVARGYT